MKLSSLARRSSRAGSILLLACILAGLSSCTVYRLPAGPSPRQALKPSKALLARFSLDGPVKEPDLALVTRQPEYVHWFGRFEAKHPDEAKTHTVKFDYFRAPGNKPAPVIVCTPILGGRGQLERSVAKRFAAAGFHAILVHRGRRTFSRTWRLEDVETFLRIAIADRRRVIDWLEKRPEVDHHRIGAFGISMGGIVTACLAPIDRRISAAVVVMGGGPIADILVQTKERPLKRFRERRMEAESIGVKEFHDRLAKSLVSDPVSLARYADPRRFLCFISRYDNIVPTPLQHKLRAALGTPECYLVPSGHYSGAAFLPFLQKKSINFFRRRFAKPVSGS